MALILAIESDRRQVSHLTSMVKARLHAELVLGDTAEAALDRLGDRVPDLILTSPLLSPKDEQALSDRLRKLNGVAAHVQTLTLPLFAPSKSRPSGSARSVFSALLGDRSGESTPDGCDPAIFAEQCREYLERSAAERDAHAHDDLTITFDRPRADAPPAVTNETAAPIAPEIAAFVEDVISHEPPPPIEYEPIGEPSIVSDRFMDAPIAAASAEPTDEPSPVDAPDADEDDLDIDLSELLEPDTTTHPVSARDERDDDPVYELSDVGFDQDQADPLPTNERHDVPKAAPAAQEFDDWQQVVEALQRESQRVQLPGRKDERTEPAAEAEADATVTPASSSTPRSRQAEDEWGVFDPEQAGMAALFAKLEQLADEDEPAWPA